MTQNVFRILSCSALTAAQCAEIEALQAAVYEAEDLHNTVWLTNEINFDRAVPCFFLGYAGKELVSFLTLFLPTREEGEVTGFTAPAHRGSGYFSRLLDAARTVLREYDIPALLFAVEPQSAGGMAYLRHYFPAAVHSHTEWRMRCRPEMLPLPAHISVEPVTDARRADYLSVVLEEYGRDPAAALMRLQAEHRAFYLVYDDKDHTPVGVFGLDHGAVLTLFGVVVAEKKRGQGYGHAVVRAALNHAAAAGMIMELDVDSENPAALHLYRKYGFQPVFEVMYLRTGV